MFDRLMIDTGAAQMLFLLCHGGCNEDEVMTFMAVIEAQQRRPFAPPWLFGCAPS